MKKFDFIDDVIAPAMMVGVTIFLCWVVYKLITMTFHVLDKLIDKL